MNDEHAPNQPPSLPPDLPPGLPQQAYYYVGRKRMPLYHSPELLALRIDPAALHATEGVTPVLRDLLSKMEPVTYLHREGLNIFRAKESGAVAQALRGAGSTAAVLAGFRRTPAGPDTVFVTSRVLAQFRGDLTPDEISAALDRHGLRIVEPLPYASPNGYLLEADPGPDGLGALRAANGLVEEGLVEFAEPDLIQARHIRQVAFPEPAVAVFLGRQWHLESSAVVDAWQETKGSPAILIAVLDDGLDVAHDEFTAPAASGQPRIAAQYDFAYGIADATPKTYIDSHGTACAGVAAAAGVKACGAAPGCRLIAARVPGWLGASDEAQMFYWAANQGADVISCSWGPPDATGEVYPLPTATQLAIRYCQTNGRGGKGIPIFWAAGNGSESVSDDGYAANPDVLAIAACTVAETPAPYSDHGPEIFACAPSNGPEYPAIFTTDRTGVAGYNFGSPHLGDANGDYTNSFGGTSAAAPLAAGIAALVLSANPQLTSAQVRDILKTTTDRIGDATDYDASGHSGYYGYGRINARRAVMAAKQAGAGVAVQPSIAAPAVWSRTSGSPTFQVDPSPNLYYIVEVAQHPDLFDLTNHGEERTSDNFFGSWQESGLLTARSYPLPAAAWERLRPADRLWYRVGSSSDPDDYVDYLVVPPDDQGSQAPSIEIVDGVAAPPPMLNRSPAVRLGPTLGVGEGRGPWVEGPLRWNRKLGPPGLRLAVPPGTSYAVELAADQDGFPPSQEGANSPRQFRSAWRTLAESQPVEKRRDDGVPLSAAFSVPPAAWRTLGRLPRLYCRIVTMQEGKIEHSPVLDIELTGRDAERYDEDVMLLPTVAGESLVRSDEALWRYPNGETR